MEQSAESQPRSESAAWPLALKIAFRFFASYLVFDGYGFPIGYLQFEALRPVTSWLYSTQVALGRWTQVHVLGFDTPIPNAFTGSGDSLPTYAMRLGAVLLAVIATIVWSLLDRRRPEYSRLYSWVSAWARLFLATVMFGYAFAKLFPTQFPTPSLERYVEPLGEFSPMGLLWTFMGHSPAYNFFAGFVEFLGAALLLFRRTATLGALIVIGAMSQVLMLNLSYDVPVKQLSIHLIVTACFIAAPDVKRLVSLLLLNKPTAPRLQAPLLRSRWGNRALLSISALFMAYIVWGNVSGARESIARRGPDAPKPVLYGIYDVAALETNGVMRPPLLTDSLRWRRIVFAREGRVTLRTMSDSVTRYQATTDTLKHSVRLVGRAPSRDTITLSYAVSSADAMTLSGRFGADTIVAGLRRLDETKFLLLNRPFRWVQERPFNR